MSFTLGRAAKKLARWTLSDAISKGKSTCQTLDRPRSGPYVSWFTQIYLLSVKGMKRDGIKTFLNDDNSISPTSRRWKSSNAPSSGLS